MRNPYLTLVKRPLDTLVAGILLVLLSPLLLATAIVVKVRLGSPVFFHQIRPGAGSQPFGMFKFRSMNDWKDDRGEMLPDADRLTRLGSFLRSSSLDELPELWNVLRGDMSFVGPRPLLTAYLDRYTVEQARRHEVRPGITGWAQIHGRNSVPWEERLQLDVWYVDHVSFRLDLFILWRTVQIVISRRGVSSHDHATMQEFAPNPAREDGG